MCLSGGRHELRACIGVPRFGEITVSISLAFDRVSLVGAKTTFKRAQLFILLYGLAIMLGKGVIVNIMACPKPAILLGDLQKRDIT